MRKKVFLLITVLLLLPAAVLMLFACKPPSSSGNKNNTGNNANDEEGFVTAETTYDAMVKDLIGGITSSLKPVSESQISASRPKASFYVSADFSINDRAATVILAADYDFKKDSNAEAGATRLGVTVTYEDESRPVAEIYLYSGGESYDELFLSVRDSKIMIPLYNTSLTDILPLAKADTTLLSTVLTANLNATDLNYRYKDEPGGMRTRKFSARIDLKASLVKLVGYLEKSPDEFAAYASGIKSMIGAIFGINPDRISSEMPSAELIIDFTTVGGVRKDGEGTGRISELKMEMEVSASASTASVFGGKAYSVGIKMNKLDVKSDSLPENVIPERSAAKFDDYYMYDSRAVSVTGKVRYDAGSVIGDGEYDLAVSFMYKGLESDDVNDAISVKVSDPNDKTYIPFELNYASHRLDITIMTRDQSGAVTVKSYASGEDEFYFTDFLSKLIKDYFALRPSMNAFETLAFVFTTLGIDGSEVSFRLDSDFFLYVLGLDIISKLYDCMQSSFRGSWQIENILKDAGIDLGAYIISTPFTITLDVSEGFLVVGDAMPENRGE